MDRIYYAMEVLRECDFLNISVRQLVQLGEVVKKLADSAIMLERERCIDDVIDYTIPVNDMTEANWGPHLVYDCQAGIRRTIEKRDNE